MANYKNVSPELKAEVITFYFQNLNNSFDCVVSKMNGRLSYFMCDKIVQEYLKNKKEIVLTFESKMNYE